MNECEVQNEVKNQNWAHLKTLYYFPTLPNDDKTSAYKHETETTHALTNNWNKSRNADRDHISI